MRYCWTALLLCALAQAADAADAVVTKVRGLSLNVDKGADHGLVAGMEVVVVRPPGEAVIHPITGENLGSPEIRLAVGEVAKVSAASGVVRLKALPLMPVRAGDVIRFVAAETAGQVMEEQFRGDVARHEEAQERQQLKSDVSSLTRDVKNIQTTIHALENMMQRLEKADERMRAQMQGINTDVNALKREMAKIRESVAALVSPKVEKGRGETADTLTSTQLDHLRQIIQDEITKLRAEIPPPAPETTAVAEHTPAIEEHHPEPEAHEEEPLEPEPVEEAHEEEPPTEEIPFYTTTWFMGTVGTVGVLGLGYYLLTFLKGRKGEEEEEEEEDEEPEAEVEVEEEEEEEDDIVVEESK